MSITFHWWLIPLAFLVGYFVLGVIYVRRRSPFEIIPGLLSVACLIVAVAFTAGHYL